MRCSVMDRNDFNDVIHTTSTWTSIKQQKFCYFYWRQICFSSIYNLLKTRNSNIDSFDVREANQDVIEWVEVYGKAFWCHSRDTKMSESENWLRNNLWIISNYPRSLQHFPTQVVTWPHANGDYVDYEQLTLLQLSTQIKHARIKLRSTNSSVVAVLRNYVTTKWQFKCRFSLWVSLIKQIVWPISVLKLPLHTEKAFSVITVIKCRWLPANFCSWNQNHRRDSLAAKTKLLGWVSCHGTQSSREGKPVMHMMKIAKLRLECSPTRQIF